MGKPFVASRIGTAAARTQFDRYCTAWVEETQSALAWDRARLKQKQLTTPGEAKKQLLRFVAAFGALAKSVRTLQEPARYIFTVALVKAKYPLTDEPRARALSRLLANIGEKTRNVAREDWKHLRGETLLRRVWMLAAEYEKVFGKRPSASPGAFFHTLASDALSTAMAGRSTAQTNFDRLIKRALRNR